MNTTKISSYNKLIAFFLIIVALLSVLVVSANGWQDENPFWENKDNNTAGGENDDTDKDDKEPTEKPTPPEEPETPKFYHHITGVEVTEEAYGDSQVAYVIDGNSPLCGIASCNVLIEFPMENQKTRYIMIADKGAEMMKVGSITYSRKFMSNLAPVFGATLVSLGNDDTVEYEHTDIGENFVELTKNPGSYYTEYTYFTYTNTKLLSTVLPTTPKNPLSLPYSFIGESDTANRSISAKTINVPYGTTTSLVFSQEQNGYCLYKMGSDKIDVSTSNQVVFTNALILYADTMTYETAEKTEMVMNTVGSGSGYFAYNGMAEEITWSMDSNGNMSLYSKNGEKLLIGRGSTYIAYVKSSKINNTIFS